MVSTIGGSSLAPSLPARVEAHKTRAVAPETPAPAPAAALDAGTEAATGVQSAQSAATARVGEQLDAQFDAARVQRAQDDAGPEEDVEGKAGAAATDAAGAEATTTEASPAAAPAGGGVRASGGGTSSSDSAATDYIAEADTNNDRKVSEEERIAYERKQASAAEKSAEAPDTLPDAAQLSRAQEVQQAYLPQETAGSQLDTSA